MQNIYKRNSAKNFIYISLFFFIIYLCFVYLGIDFERFFSALGRFGSLIANRYYPVEISYVLEPGYLSSILDSLQMGYLGLVFGVIIASVLAYFAASNITPSKKVGYAIGKFFIIFSRSIHETIWTIIFVTIVGYGMFAGTIALTMYCIGFFGKLFSEEIENIDMRLVDTMRSNGANDLQVFAFGVWPQVKTSFTGILIYTWDVCFRASTIIGFFGAGGMGWYLKRNVLQLEYARVSAIILSIIFLVILSETLSGYMRNKIYKETQ
jgi:phosphonate transport system permease protein